MKNLKHHLILLFLSFSFYGFSQNNFDVNAIRYETMGTVFISNYSQSEYIAQDISSKYFFIERGLPSERIYSCKSISNYSLYVRAKFLKLEETHPYFNVFFGIGYKKFLTNGIMFWEEKFDPDLVFVENQYYLESELVSANAKFMVSSSKDKIFSFGVGVTGGLGYEINSNYVKNVIQKKRYGFFSDRTVIDTKTYKYNADKNMMFSLSVPLELSIRFSKNKNSFLNRTKLFMFLSYGYQQFFHPKLDYNSTFFDFGSGLQIGF